MPEITVSELDVMAEGTWSFTSNFPRWRHSAYGSIAEFDPFPAYPHDLGLVAAAARHVQQRFAPRWDVKVFVADREEIGRSNGFSGINEGGRWDADDKWVKGDPTGVIVLSGKRIPPHPAMAAYLVAHEYGHNVEWMLEHVHSGGQSVHGQQVVTEYAVYRGLPTPVHDGSGGRWHDSAVEVLACDFRVVVCEVDPDYWPHPGVPHPRDLPRRCDLRGWWNERLR